MNRVTIAVLAAASLPGLAHAGPVDPAVRADSTLIQQASRGEGCFVTVNPTEAEKGIRFWRRSCVDWYKRIEKLRPLQANPAEAPWVHVIVRRVDLAAGRVTVSHGAIPQIRMPPMTINFPVADPAQLATLHMGEEVDIQCEHHGGVVKVLNFRTQH